jgi:signal transduction histidine kinase
MAILARTTRKPPVLPLAARAVASTRGALLAAGVIGVTSVWRLLKQASVMRRLRRQNERVAELEQMKSMYLRLASHELRTPIGVARGYVDLLESGELGTLPEPAQQALSQVGASLEEVDALVAEMVEIARMEEGRRLLRLEILDLREPVQEASQRVLPLVAPGHRVVMEQPDVPLWVRGDRVRIRSAARNLLENAIKYSPAGGEIRCAVSEEKGVASIVVSDQGLGIDPADMDAVFGRFQRAPEAESRSIPGLGLGLHLVREIARAHGGDLRVSSNPGPGATFVLSLPAEPLEELASGRSSRAAS